MPDNVEVQHIKRHKRIAESALKKLEDLGVKSWNKPFNSDKKQRRAKIGAIRHQMGQDGHYDNFQAWTERIEGSQLGNCWERGTVFAYYASLHPDIRSSKLYRVECVGWDHVWAVMTRVKLNVGEEYSISDLGTSGVILDGWTQDWWFPNVSAFDTVRLGCWRAGKPFALGVRAKIQTTSRRFEVQTECEH